MTDRPEGKHTGISRNRSGERAGSGTRKPRRSQVPLGIAAGILLIAIGVYFLRREPMLGFFWFTGIAFGFVLQRARFCFVASMRDPVLTGRAGASKGVLAAFALTSVGFWAIMYGAYQSGAPVPGMNFVAPIGVHTAAGAFIFGIGMVIAGGCASGTLMRVGEGYAMQMLALVFFVVGTVIGSAHFGWWQRMFISSAPRVHLPDVFGWFGAILVQLLIIAFLWIALDKYIKAKQQSGSGKG